MVSAIAPSFSISSNVHTLLAPSSYTVLAVIRISNTTADAYITQSFSLKPDKLVSTISNHVIIRITQLAGI